MSAASTTTRFDVAGQMALVTGGASGIGRATCRILADSGARVAVLDRNLDAAEQTVKEIGDAAIAIGVDVADPASVEAAVAEVVRTFGRLDIAVNSAGIGSVETLRLHEVSYEGYRKVTAINLDGVWLSLKYELAAMLANGNDAAGRGAIVNVASMLGLIGQQYSSAYSAAKAGVLGMTRTAALEYAADGIRINAIAPGYIETPMVTDRLAADGRELEELAQRTPNRRVGKPEDIARTIVFLASRDSVHTTGETVVVDGGYTVQ